MSVETWLGLQSQLWAAFGPLVQWFIIMLMVGEIGAISIVFASIFFTDWISG